MPCVTRCKLGYRHQQFAKAAIFGQSGSLPRRQLASGFQSHDIFTLWYNYQSSKVKISFQTSSSKADFILSQHVYCISDWFRTFIHYQKWINQFDVENSTFRSHNILAERGAVIWGLCYVNKNIIESKTFFKSNEIILVKSSTLFKDCVHASQQLSFKTYGHL